MRFFTKQRVLTLAVVFLLLTNIATLGTIFYHKWIFKHHFINNNPKFKIARFVRDELNLTDEQLEKYINCKKNCCEKEDLLNNQLRDNRLLIYKELSKQVPDTLKLDSLAKNAGSFFTKLNSNNINNYLNIRTICNEEQKDKLCDIFEEASKNIRNEKGPHRRCE